MVKKVITNLNLSKAPDLDCILVVVLIHCEPQLSYILAEPFNICLFSRLLEESIHGPYI